MSRRLRILIGGIVLALMLAKYGAHIYATFAPPAGSNDVWEGRWEGKGEPYITGLKPEGERAGL